MNVGTYLDRAAERLPRHPAIFEGDESVSYAEWCERSGRIASVLREHGVARGDRVALLMPNSALFLETLFAVLRMGAVVVPFNSRSHPKECEYMLAQSGSKAFVADPRLYSEAIAVATESAGVATLRSDALRAASADAEPLAAVDAAPEDLAWFFYTSGTTGRPKAAMVTHGNLEFMTDLYLADVYPAGPHDRALHAGPLTHGSGLWSISLVAAAATHVVPRSASFDPAEIFGLIERHRVTKLVFLSPTMIKILLESEAARTADCSSLRFVGYGGAPIHPEDLTAALDRWGPVLCNIYGQGECPMTITMLSPSNHAEALARHPDRLRSVGPARRGIEVTVRGPEDDVLGPGEIGEVCVNGRVVMRGYWENEDATAEAFRDGTYHTGDLGSFDADGFLHLRGRVKELVISGGSNIYPREVEDVLAAHDHVADVAVFGIPDRHWGESVVAAVVPRGQPPDRQELLELCRANLASYKKPRWIVFVDDLPRSAYGKVLKRELVERFSDLARREEVAQ